LTLENKVRIYISERASHWGASFFAQRKRSHIFQRETFLIELRIKDKHFKINKHFQLSNFKAYNLKPIKATYYLPPPKKLPNKLPKTPWL
jgi:hypothetical protein